MPRNKETILVVGGAGYIGSHMVDALMRQGYNVIVFDNLSTGHREAVLGAIFIQGDLSDTVLLNSIFNQYAIDAVMHFAASIEVVESIDYPQRYYHNNLINTLHLLDAMLTHSVKLIIFSSTAAVYGEPCYLPVDEAHPKMPVNPYGRSKWMIEQILQDYAQAYGLKSISLRYFNAAGADPLGVLGPRYSKITHLILLALSVARGFCDHIDIFGDDYDTSDGTCVRDYIHVVDVCNLHLLALDSLLKGAPHSAAYNVGSGRGYSVSQVLEVARFVTGQAIPSQIKPRRAGDAAVLVANTSLAQHTLGWTPLYPSLEKMIEDTWKFIHKRQRIAHAQSV